MLRVHRSVAGIVIVADEPIAPPQEESPERGTPAVQSDLAGETRIDRSQLSFQARKTFPWGVFIATDFLTQLSNFLLWQAAYAELVFTDVLWPDFRRENLFEAVREYQRRTRRFGGVDDDES